MAALAGAVALAACELISPRVPLETIAFTVADKANNNAPIAVDLVMVSAGPQVDAVLAMTAQDWFQKREQFQRDYPNEIQVASWELVPGQVRPPERVKRKENLFAAVVFASYNTPGAHRVRLGVQENPRVVLGEKTFTIVP